MIDFSPLPLIYYVRRERTRHVHHLSVMRNDSLLVTVHSHSATRNKGILLKDLKSLAGFVYMYVCC